VDWRFTGNLSANAVPLNLAPPVNALPARLNLGCGQKKLPGHLNVDRVASIQPDLVHDLDVHPYPLPDGAFEEICAYDVVEHVADVTVFMNEIWRVAQPGAVVKLTTPHFSCSNSYTDPTHRRHLGWSSFDYFTQGHQWNYYGSDGFEIRHRSLVFAPSLMNKLVGRLANRFPDRYEARWAWCFPAWFLYFELTVHKAERVA
jgi:SAM-dependent methyltransferase